MTKRPSTSVAITISMPKSLLDAVDAAAAMKFKDRSNYIRDALVGALPREYLVREDSSPIQLPGNIKPIRYKPNRKKRSDES